MALRGQISCFTMKVPLYAVMSQVNVLAGTAPRLHLKKSSSVKFMTAELGRFIVACIRVSTFTLLSYKKKIK